MFRETLAGLLLAVPMPLPAQALPAPKKIRIAEGIYLFITAPYGDAGLDGNSIAILTPDGVLVFDSNGTPAAASAVLAEIKAMTSAPVRYLVNSHWHWDHWYGAEVYRQAFPGIQIITHEKTRQMMMGPELAFNKPGLDRDLPQHIAMVEERVKALAGSSPGSPELERARRHLEQDRFFLEQKSGIHRTVANLTFTDSLTIYLGEREIRVLHYDRAVTPGDTFLYLPKEKVLVTGDLLVNPISFALSCYPSGWLATLEKIDALDAAVLVPGHGEPLHDKALLETHIAIFRELLRRGREAHAKGQTADQAAAAALPELKELMVRLTHDDPNLNQQFGVYLVDWYLHRVYDELEGKLSDEIVVPRH
ncbi:MAG TPA: MBL fold metallo-hydrolase [Gemmatimonadales bacterium]|nr:MBL fold metallo-hydrolase [Gemmatimonadales bacterium]